MANWQQYSIRLALKAKKDRDIKGSSSVDYLMYSGYIMGYFWAQMAQTAYVKWLESLKIKTFIVLELKLLNFILKVYYLEQSLWLKP
ncbi:hypothetical protein [Paraglaciecola psychrophila]|uniref:hypothetical protein n=1 Tax=Paraglaciecola psychrophila TaxID=326544 RepID=UPI001F36A5D3|nr:hypothetical protein [Paraglaciecola psychrophila]